MEQRDIGFLEQSRVSRARLLLKPGEKEKAQAFRDEVVGEYSKAMLAANGSATDAYLPAWERLEANWLARITAPPEAPEPPKGPVLRFWMAEGLW